MAWVYIWLAVIVLALVIEFITLDLVSVWIAVGGFIGMILALCKATVEAQIIVSVIVAIACIIGLRKITLKFLNRNQGKTNLDLAIGTKVKLLSAITKDSDGSAKYNGVVWTAKCEDNVEIAEGEYALIERVEGNKLIVKKQENLETTKENEHIKEKKTTRSKTNKKEEV